MMTRSGRSQEKRKKHATTNGESMESFATIFPHHHGRLTNDSPQRVQTNGRDTKVPTHTTNPSIYNPSFRMSPSAETKNLQESPSSTSLANDDADVVVDNDDDNDDDEVRRLQRECSAMVKLLKNLEQEEHDLQCQLEVIVREALLCGFDPTVLEPASYKRRPRAPATPGAAPGGGKRRRVTSETKES